MKLNKARVNLFVDLAIGFAALVEAVSGFVLWLVLPHVGYQGGRGTAINQSFILSRSDWLALHDWFALIIVLGVLLHVALHWKWIVCMVRGLWQQAFPRRAPSQAQGQDCAS